MMRKWTSIVVDDEPRARAVIRKMMCAARDFEIVRECSNGYEAIDAVRTLGPDVMFLDVQMPEIDGLAVLNELRDEKLPAIVFVTAYDRYAIKAFEVRAIDYLLKPFDEERFLNTLDRVRERMGTGPGNGSEKILSLLQELKPAPEYRERFAVRTGGRIVLVTADEVEWIEAEDKYVRLHTGTGSYLVRETLTRLQDTLDPKRFIRVHRSALVRVDSVREIHPDFHGDYRIVLKGGAKLALGRSYRDKFFGLIHCER
ncbi:MAG TPA: LytTR family DNA-binding domain-containing protein [Blastocatellia bacterium]